MMTSDCNDGPFIIVIIIIIMMMMMIIMIATPSKMNLINKFTR